MLAEIRGARQIPGEGFRRWFRDDSFDLIVFYPSELREEITGFQLCYRGDDGERVLSWYKDRGYRHNKVDDGETAYHNKMSPILVDDGVFHPGAVLEKFLPAAGKVDADIVGAVSYRVGRLRESPARPA